MDNEEMIRIPKTNGVIFGVVTVKGEVVNIENTEKDKRFKLEFDGKENYKTNTILGVPIFDKNDQIIGVIQAFNKKTGYFTKEDEGLLQILGNLAGCTLKNSLMYNDQLVAHKQLCQLLQLNAFLTSIESTKELILITEKKLKSFLRFTDAKILIADSNSDEFIHYLEAAEEERFSIELGIAGYVFQTGTLVSFENSQQQLLIQWEYRQVFDIESQLPFICFPISQIQQNTKFGVIELINPKGLESMQEKQDQKKSIISTIDREVLEQFSEMFSSLILRNQELKR